MGGRIGHRAAAMIGIALIIAVGAATAANADAGGFTVGDGTETGGDGVTRLVIIEPNETAHHRFFFDRL